MRKGQAITEIGVLGAIILFLLSILLTYGLRFNYQQEVSQHAFRRSMAIAARYGSGAPYSLFYDKHIPNPADAQGVGSVVGTSAAYSITRTYRAMQMPETIDQIANITIGFGRGMLGIREVGFKTARFNNFFWKPCNHDALKHLQLIFGATNVQSTGHAPNPDPMNPEEVAIAARVVDPCLGDILSYESCQNQCKMFTDFSFCFDQCWTNTGSEMNCQNVCRSGLEAPDYCADLDGLFAYIHEGHEKIMGVQPDVIQFSQRNDAMNKRESSAGISTSDVYGSRDVITRRIVIRNGQRTEDNTVPIGDAVDMGAQW